MGTKIKDKLQNRTQPISYSMEFVCPKTEQGVVNLVERINRMAKLAPLFVDITWNAGGNRSNSDTPLELVDVCEGDIRIDTCMHMTCVGMSETEVNSALESAYNSGCRNILALRGDKPREEVDENEQAPKFRYAKDLIHHIRAKYGDEVSIPVAGYPEGHPEEKDPDRLIAFLKEKCDAGADLIVTQMFYNADIFIDWYRRVRAAGITTPIAPGIMPVSGWASFLRRAKWCQIDLPSSWIAELEPLKHDDEAVRARGTLLVAEMCRKILANTDISHLHFYTMNLEKSPLMLLEALDLVKSDNDEVISSSPGFTTTPTGSETLPANPRRRRGSSLNTVRPIHWRNRPASYSLRTATWDEFPNGRWGDSRSPAFNQLNELDVLLKVSSQQIREWWGFPTSAADVGALVIKYLRHEITSLPWSDAPAASEVTAIADELKQINSGTHRWFSINSQPALNAVSSGDLAFGWGPPHGFVFQKANLELMVHPEVWHSYLRPRLRETLAHEATYYAVNSDSAQLETNAQSNAVDAITWGIFPNKEVVQPTIVEGTSFLAWKDEAFRIAHEWSRSYPSGSPSQQFLAEIATQWYLVNIVHHDFRDPSAIFKVLGLTR